MPRSIVRNVRSPLIRRLPEHLRQRGVDLRCFPVTFLPRGSTLCLKTSEPAEPGTLGNSPDLLVLDRLLRRE